MDSDISKIRGEWSASCSGCMINNGKHLLVPIRGLVGPGKDWI